MRALTQSITLLLASLLVFIILNTELNLYIAPILGVIIAFNAIYIAIQRRSKGKKELLTGSNVEIFGIMVTVLLIIFLTGGINSSVFFLVYFLLFGIAFLFEPITVFVFALSMAIVFILPTLQDDIASNLIKAGSLLFLAPIAYFFGREFKKRDELEKKVDETARDIAEDANTLLHSKMAQNNEDVEEIDDIIEKTEKLRSSTDRES